jgi:tetratricopeptide (TPR) repeat protein
MKGDLKQFPDAYFQSGDFYLRVNDVNQAIKEYEAGLKKDSSRKNRYLKHEIQAYVISGKVNLAYDKNEELLKNDPKGPESRGLKATFMLDRGDVNTAMGELQSVVTAKPNNFVARASIWDAPTSHAANSNRPVRNSARPCSCDRIICPPLSRIISNGMEAD